MIAQGPAEVRLLACGWSGNNMGVIIYSFNVSISPKTPHGVLDCGIALLQNDTGMTVQ